MANTMVPFNGVYLDATGQLRSLLTGNPVDSSAAGMVPMNGNFLDEQGNVHNMTELRIGDGSTPLPKVNLGIVAANNLQFKAGDTVPQNIIVDENIAIRLVRSGSYVASSIVNLTSIYHTIQFGRNSNWGTGTGLESSSSLQAVGPNGELSVDTNEGFAPGSINQTFIFDWATNKAYMLLIWGQTLADVNYISLRCWPMDLAA